MSCVAFIGFYLVDTIYSQNHNQHRPKDIILYEKAIRTGQGKHQEVSGYFHNQVKYKKAEHIFFTVTGMIKTLDRAKYKQRK